MCARSKKQEARSKKTKKKKNEELWKKNVSQQCRRQEWAR